MTIKFNDESTWLILFKNDQLISNVCTGNDDCWKTPGVVWIKLESRKSLIKVGFYFNRNIISYVIKVHSTVDMQIRMWKLKYLCYHMKSVKSRKRIFWRMKRNQGQGIMSEFRVFNFVLLLNNSKLMVVILIE